MGPWSLHKSRPQGTWAEEKEVVSSPQTRPTSVVRRRPATEVSSVALDTDDPPLVSPGVRPPVEAGALPIPCKGSTEERVLEVR